MTRKTGIGAKWAEGREWVGTLVCRWGGSPTVIHPICGTFHVHPVLRVAGDAVENQGEFG